MSTKKTAKKVGAGMQSAAKLEQLKRDAKVRALRDSDPEKWTWVKLDLHFWKKKTHGGNSFVAYKREAARLKAVKRSHHATKKTAVKVYSAAAVSVPKEAAVCGGVTE